MIKFQNEPTWLGKSGVLLLCVQLFVFIFALYPFQSGTWFNVEPTMLALFMLASVCSLWLGLGISKRWLVLETPIHPLIYGLLAWASLQFLLLPFADNKLYSWMGLPQTGEGAAWQVMLAVFVFFAMPLWRVKSYKKILFYCAVISLCTMTYLQFNPAMFCDLYKHQKLDSVFLPNNFADYLSFIAGWLWIIYASSASLRNPRLHVFVVIICSIAIYISDSIAGRFILYPILIGSGAMIFLQIKPNKIWKILAIIGLIVPLFWTFVPLNQELKLCNNTSIAIRKIINETALSTLAHEPQRIIFGNGWGNFKDDMFRYSLIEKVHAFKDGELAPNFTLLNGQVFHPHNQPMAALFALGIFGFIIFISLPIFALLPLRNNLFWWSAPMLVGITAIGLLWFTLPQVLPFQALGLAAICAGRKTHFDNFRKIPQLFSVISLIFSLLFAASSWQQLETIKYSERLKTMMDEDPNKADVIEFIESDIPRGSQRMTQGIFYFSKEISDKVASVNATEADRDWYRNFLEITHKAAISLNASTEIIKLEAELSMLLFRLPNPSPLDDLKPQAKNTLLDSILRLSEKAPQREDAIAFFLMSLDGFTNGDLAKQKEILEKILEIAPNHRSALWLLGNLTNDSEMKSRALELGVERVYPISNYTHSE